MGGGRENAPADGRGIARSNGLHGKEGSIERGALPFSGGAPSFLEVYLTSLYPEGTVKSEEGIEETSIFLTSE